MAAVATVVEAAVCPTHQNYVANSKDTWDSLPNEIKQKVVKYVPLRTRIGVKRVCKQWLTIVNDLNDLETKLVLDDEREYTELPYHANSLCNFKSHKFDRTLILKAPRGLDKQILRNFPNLVAVHVAREQATLGAFVNCRNMEHLSSSGYGFGFEYTNLKGNKWTCLQDTLVYSSMAPMPFSNLKFYSGYIRANEEFAVMLERGLIGYKMWADEQRQHLIEPYITTTEVLYEVEFENTNYMDLMRRMPNLNAIYGKGDCEDLSTLDQLTGLTKLSWKGTDSESTEEAIRNALMPWGHRLRSLRIGIELLSAFLIRAVLASCPNLEELHVHEYLYEEDMDIDKVQSFNKRNFVGEFNLLKQLTKLKTLSIDFHDVDLKFLRMFNPKIPELKVLGEVGPLTIKQLIQCQYEITERKAKDKRILELESQLAKYRKS